MVIKGSSLYSFIFRRLILAAFSLHCIGLKRFDLTRYGMAGLVFQYTGYLFVVVEAFITSWYETLAKMLACKHNSVHLISAFCFVLAALWTPESLEEKTENIIQFFPLQLETKSRKIACAKF